MPQSFAGDDAVLEPALQRLMWTEQKRFVALLDDHHLTLPQFLVLASIHQHGAGCPIGTPAEEMFQSYPTMTGIMARLKDAGLVSRGADPADRRKGVISLTQAGRTLLARAKNARCKRMARALAHLTPRSPWVFALAHSLP